MKERYTDINEYIRDLQEEIAKDPKCAIHHYNLGVAMLSLGDYAEAENCFLEAVRQSSHIAEAYVQLRAKYPIPWANMGFVHLQRGEVDEAITALHKALTWDPRYVQARATFASALYMKGEYEKSAEMSRMVLKEQPAFGPAWNNLSLATFELGDVEKAREYAEKAYEFGYDVSDDYWKELKEASKKA